MTEPRKIEILGSMGYSLQMLDAAEADAAILHLFDGEMQSDCFALLASFIENCSVDEFVNLKIDLKNEKA